MLIRQFVVWLFALAVLSVSILHFNSDARQASLIVSNQALLPAGECSVEELSSELDPELLITTAARSAVGLPLYEAVSLVDVGLNTSLCLCRDFPIGQSPPLVG